MGVIDAGVDHADHGLHGADEACRPGLARLTAIGVHNGGLVAIHVPQTAVDIARVIADGVDRHDPIGVRRHGGLNSRFFARRDDPGRRGGGGVWRIDEVERGAGLRRLPRPAVQIHALNGQRARVDGPPLIEDRQLRVRLGEQDAGQIGEGAERFLSRLAGVEIDEKKRASALFGIGRLDDLNLLRAELLEARIERGDIHAAFKLHQKGIRKPIQKALGAF